MHGEQNLTKNILKLYADYHYIVICIIVINWIELFFKVDISSVIGYVLSIKTENEVALMKKASLCSVDMFTKYLKEQIMEIIDSDKVYLF